MCSCVLENLQAAELPRIQNEKKIEQNKSNLEVTVPILIAV
jgi:hypothetical protein